MRIINTVSHNLTAPAVAHLAGIREDGNHVNFYMHGSVRVPNTSVLVCLADKEIEWQQALRVFMSSINKDVAKLPRYTVTVQHVINGSLRGSTPIRVSYCLLIFKPKSLALNLSGLDLNFKETK